MTNYTDNDREKLYEKVRRYGTQAEVLQINLASASQTATYLRQLADDIDAGEYEMKEASVSIEKSTALQTLEVKTFIKKYL